MSAFFYAIDRLPRMPVIKLLKSCAIPSAFKHTNNIFSVAIKRQRHDEANASPCLKIVTNWTRRLLTNNNEAIVVFHFRFCCFSTQYTNFLFVNILASYSSKKRRSPHGFTQRQNRVVPKFYRSFPLASGQ